MFSFNNKGILGINARNLLYLRPYNPKKAIKLADDKIKTKQFLSARGIPVPKLYGTIRSLRELEKFDFNILPQTFVLKPSQGYGGEGIIPILSKENQKYQATGGEQFTLEKLKDHIRDILDGRFSISSANDIAFFEQYIISDETLAKYSYEGLADIRIVIHNLIPVMAMLRLPTKESKGKANLHQGAIGVGIDIAKGQTTYLSYKNRIIDELPNGLGKMKGVKIPFWDDLLMISSQVQLVTNLGYMAVDLSIDHHNGPVLLEINARAGLGLQIANLAPLRKRLERIEGISVTNPKKGVRIAKDIFGNSVEKEIANISGKQIIGIDETIKIIHKNEPISLPAKISSTKNISVIDQEFALENGLLESGEAIKEGKTLKLKLSLKGKRLQTMAEIEDLSGKEYKMIIGIRDLSEFLIDPSKKKEKNTKKIHIQKSEDNHSAPKSNFHQIDKQLCEIETQIKLLYHLRPTNLETEKTKFFKNFSKSPQFEYPKLKFDPITLTQNLNNINIDESPLGKIFRAKKEEIASKIELIEAMDEERFTEVSIKLFGKPSLEEVEQCKNLIKELKIKNKIGIEPKNQKKLNTTETKKKFEEVFEKYNLPNWKVKIKENMVSDCLAGKTNTLFLKKGSRFTDKRIQALIIHEIETHVLTAENGKNQPYEIFNKGLNKYLLTQEGLAMYNVANNLNEPFEENIKALSHVLAIHYCLNNSFVATFHKLIAQKISPEQAFKSTLKAKRGFYNTDQSGAFTKDLAYFKGYYQIKKFVENGGHIPELYIGKINHQDLEEIKSLPGIIPPKHLPDWLS